MNEKSVHLAEAEARARKSALKRVAEMFSSPEQLDKIGLYRSQFTEQKVATEAQLRMALCSQLDGARLGMNKLDQALLDAQSIKLRSFELIASLNNLDGVSKELKQTKNLAKKYGQLAAAMENMSYLVKVPELFKSAHEFVEQERLLDAHKIVQDLEGIRDVLMSEVYKEHSHGDMETLVTYFKGVEELNLVFVEKIKMIGARLLNAVISERNMVIECVRVIDREERADLIWQKRSERNGFLPLGRPKRWKKLFFDATANTIRDKVFGSALDGDTDKHKMIRHNEAIRQHAMSDLKIAKNICPIYFPPDYNIFDRIVEMYHEAIGEHVEALIATNLKQKDIAHLLIWINSYRTEEFMGDPFLNIDFNRLNLKRPVTLLPAEQLQAYSESYVNDTMREFCAWSRNSLARHSQDWRRQTPPEMDGLSYYYTGLPRLVMTPLTEMTGKGNLLRALGDSVRENFFIKIVDQIESFVSDYSNTLKLYRQEYLEDRSRFHYYIEYMLANGNDAISFADSFAKIVMEELSDSPRLKGHLTSQINLIKVAFTKLADKCRTASEEVVLMDLNTVLNNVMTPKWLDPDDITANCFQGTLADYDETLRHARPALYEDIVNNVGEKLLLEYLRVIMNRRCPFKSEAMRRRAGEKLMMDGHMIQNYLREQMKVREELVSAYGCISDIARLFREDDCSMLYLDTANLLKRFPDMRPEQLFVLLMARGDIRSPQARELANSSVIVGEQRVGTSPLNIFTKLAAGGS